ncbi:MAG TPA: nitroreductase family protein [Spirochaetota bacterium]|nr:nitroreductase family protein [Spirochaetota bacterium]
MSNDTILTKDPGFRYHEKAPKIDAKEFQKVIDSRRSVRIYEKEPIPDKIIQQCLRNALLAPNSSNLQPWEIYHIATPEVRQQMNKACLEQIAAKSAAALFVAVARTNTWKEHAKEMVQLFEAAGNVPKSAIAYYKKLVPFVYNQGLFGIWGLIKRILFFIRGLKTPVIHEPVSHCHMKIWAVKSTALACQNLMLSLRAYGYDSCPMEGYDSKLIKKILQLPDDAVVVMVISAGKRAIGGIYGPRIRYDENRFLKRV